jgi:hypothetical protein
VVEQARAAWLAHDVRGLVAHSDTVRLRLPGVAASAATRPGQAARLLEEYLSAATEQEFTLRELRYVQADHAYAELSRRYAVKGTADVREEMVFLGFRQVNGRFSPRLYSPFCRGFFSQSGFGRESSLERQADL